MPGSIVENIVCDRVIRGTNSGSGISSELVATCRRLVRERIPNLFRLYLNPHVATNCHLLSRIVSLRWPDQSVSQRPQAFLANSLDEAVSGAVKLARFAANERRAADAATNNSQLHPRGVLFDPLSRLTHFATTRAGSMSIRFLPDIDEVRDENPGAGSKEDGDSHDTGGNIDFIVWFEADVAEDRNVSAGLRRLLAAANRQVQRPLLICCLDRDSVFSSGRVKLPAMENCVPHIVVFDESFTDHDVPFGAFVAGDDLFGLWNVPGKATFHSTTFQPNSISSLHMLRCLDRFASGLMTDEGPTLQRIDSDADFRRQVFGKSYSRSLAKLICVAGFDHTDVRTDGHYVVANDRRVFDCVAGVACGVRGHNPDTYAEELETAGDTDECRVEVETRLSELTGLQHVTPAVSGASAVEQALKIALVAQAPRTWVLALRGGFGGKTLFALTGTSGTYLKEGLDPLYPRVVFVDPFADDAVAQLHRAFERYPIGVVQLELIQGVGGVRPVPAIVLSCLKELRSTHDCLLFVDEVQTGMFRTGPFLRSTDCDIQPDVLTIGKGTSDMMFPFALTLHSDDVQRRLDAVGSSIAADFLRRNNYPAGYRTVLGTLRRAADQDLEARVIASGRTFTDLLTAALADCPVVADVRCFGLLAGIELRVVSGSPRRLQRAIWKLSLLAMVQHPTFPILAGFCQYEPNVLKLTPPLTVTHDELQSICATIADVLRRSAWRLLADTLPGVAMRPLRRRLRFLTFGRSNR